jgi:hypothetical protein
MEHVNTQQAAAYVGCSRHTLRKSRYTGVLLGLPAPSYLKLGVKVLYKTQELDRWLSSVPQITNTAMGRSL